jgi:excisionase family DNA binding protein
MTLPVFTTTTAAAELGVTPGRVRAMIAAGRLKANRAGRDWLIEPKALATVRDRKPGRPATPNKGGRPSVE